MGRRRRRRKMRAQKAAQSKQVKSGVARVKSAVSAMKSKSSLGGGFGGIISKAGTRSRGGSSKFTSRKKANTMRSKTGKYSEASKHAKHVQGRTSDNVKQHGASLKAKYAKNYQSSKLIKG